MNKAGGLVVMTGLVLAGGLLLGRLDEHFYVLGLAPLLLGYLMAWGDSRLSGYSPSKVPVFWIGLGLVALAAGRWWESRLIFDSQWVMAMGVEGGSAGPAFDQFLNDEVGFDGLAGFLAVRLESGIRVFGDRGIALGAIGGGVQWLFEVFACFWGGRLRLGRSYTHLDAKDLEHEAEGQ